MHIGIGMGMIRPRAAAGGGATVPAVMSAPALAQIDQTRLSVTRAAAPANGGSAILSYDLRFSTDQVSWTVVAGIAAVQTVTGLAAGTLYFVQTRAVNAVGPAGWSASASLSTVVASPANTALPVISGVATQGQTLSVTNGTWSNAPTGFTYQWKRAGTAISGATATTYLLVNADAGSAITCTVTASNAGGSSSATSAATGAVLPLAPANSVLPAITGTATQDQTLTVSTGTWANGTSGFAYQWKRTFNSVTTAISGAVAGSYVLTGADVGYTITCTVTATNAGGSTAATSAATSAVAQSQASLPTTPTARWHPAFSTVTTASGSVTTATDLQGLANVTEGSSGLGPLALTDALGRKFWRFEGKTWLTIANGLTMNKTGTSVFFVGRMHRATGTNRVISIGVNGINGYNSGGAVMEFKSTLSGATWTSTPFLLSMGKTPSGGTGPQKLIPGAGLMVAGVSSRISTDGGMRFMMDAYAENVGSQTAGTGNPGGEIGRYASSPSTSGLWGMFDLYELVVYNGVLTDAALDAIQAALFANYAITPKVNRAVFDGDSITQGIVIASPASPGVTSGVNVAMVATAPGSTYLPANWHVYNMGHAGDSIQNPPNADPQNILFRRDVAEGWPNYKLSGQNVVIVQIGRNDFNSFDEVTAYANLVPYLNTTTTGVLQRGWAVRMVANIATQTATTQTRIVNWRAKLRNSAFLTDTLTGPGQSFDGKLQVISTDLIQISANNIFLDTSDSLDTTYYQGDGTHPNVIATAAMVSGGDDPTKGMTYGLTA